jgi:hypothetical protein
MVKLRLVQPSSTPTVSERRFETDYAGVWRGHCKTRESAIMAGMRHILQDGYSRATITDKHTGEVVARLRLSNDRKSVHVVAEKVFKKIGL